MLSAGGQIPQREGGKDTAAASEQCSPYFIDVKTGK